jgi:hypothetical protein
VVRTVELRTQYEGVFRRAYGVEPQPDRQAFYRLLYDLAS